MRPSSTSAAIGLMIGLAMFAMAGLAFSGSAHPATATATGTGTDRSMVVGPLDPTAMAPAEQLGKAFAMLSAHVKPCVVSVYSEKTLRFSQREFSIPFGDDFFHRFFGDPFQEQPDRKEARPRRREFRGQQRGMGSGMILDKQGHVLTNFHVVRNVDAIKVKLADKRSFDAVLVGSDPKTDVAIIKITGRLPDDLPIVTLGDSDALEVGGLVLAIGAPFGLAQTVTEGIISATGRSDVGIADYENFLQTDTPINPGNSGGPLVSMRGEVVGMNSAIASGVGQFAGVGFAIPSNMIRSLLPRLTKGERIVRGQLGVVIQDLTKDLAKQFGLRDTNGVLVTQLGKDSPAAKAGLKIGDVIVRYQSAAVGDVRQLRNLVAATAPGTKAKIDLIRDGKELLVVATVGKQDEEQEEPTSLAPGHDGTSKLETLGLGVETLTPRLAAQLKLGATKGVVVTDVDEGSAAALAGFQPGDLIVEAGRKPVRSVEDLKQALARAKDQDAILLLVRRQEMSLYVVLPTH